MKATGKPTTATPQLGLTESFSATYISTGNPCLDFFFQVVPDTPKEELVNSLQSSWTHDPLTTMKLICNLRAVRDTGKSEKEGFYTAALWLHENHPKTLACNVKAMADFSCFKDMLEILYRILEGPEVRKIQRNEVLVSKGGKKRKSRGNSDKEKARMERLKKTVEKARKALDKYKFDFDYQFLYDKISDFFLELLKADLGFYHDGILNKISLASKWCPSLDSSYDKALLICEKISRKLFPVEDFLKYQDMEDAHYAFKVRDRLRREVLVPLHKALELPEVYICTNKWDTLPYDKVASVTMNLYKSLFYRHDKDRFEAYLVDVKSGKATIAAGALLPHKIIKSLEDETGPEVAELQWERMVADLAKRGKLTNCMAICGVSGDMWGVPMDVFVALGLLVSELSQEPWKGKLITFSYEPELQLIHGENLKDKTKFIRRMDSGASGTNFQKVFDQILEVASKGKLMEEQMINRLFVFSDMEFDQASLNSWETDYKVIQKKFRENGYEKVPEIVFWNLRNSIATPVTSDQEGVALVSGFSKNLVTLFLEEGGNLNSEAVMLRAISGKKYQELVVYD